MPRENQTWRNISTWSGHIDKKISQFTIIHLLCDDNRHADSMIYLTLKIHLDIPRTTTVDVRDKPSYIPPLEVHMVKDLENSSCRYKGHLGEHIFDNLVKGIFPDSIIEAYKVWIMSKTYIIIMTSYTASWLQAYTSYLLLQSKQT